METKIISLESEAGFRVLFECATISILVINDKGVIELANPCAEVLFGYAPGELIGEPVEILIPESLRIKHERHREGYFAAPRTRPMGLGIELHARKKNGDVLPVAISLGHYELAGEKLAVAFVSDISDQVKANKLLAERESSFRSMADNSPVMIWVSGTDSACTYFNKAWLKFTGRLLQDELGVGWVRGVHPDDVERCLFTYTEAFKAREPFSMEYRIQRSDGQYRWILDTGEPTYSEEEFTGFIGSCSDIHDQKIMQDELEVLVKTKTLEISEALDREKEMNELKSRFVSMASHEFRTPLSVVLSSISLIEQYGVTKADQRVQKHLDKIKSSVSNLTSILNDFLSLDKLEQGKVEVEIHSFDLYEFVSEIIDDLKIVRREGQNIRLSYEGDHNVSLDQNKLRYILFNLISNSIKYSASQTEIKISVAVYDDKTVSITIQDHGIGIPVEEQKLLFSKFFRAKNTGSIQGTGLGLTIVKRYVELMGGDVSFVSKVGEGTTFTVQLKSADHVNFL